MKNLWFWLILLTFQLGFAQEKIPLIDYNSVMEEASTMYQKGDLEGVVETLSRINKNDSTYSTVLVKKSYYQLQLGKYDEAIALCNEGLASNTQKNRNGFFINKTVSYYSSEQYEKALEVVDEALKEFPKNRKLWYNKALIYESMGKTEEAIALYKKTILLDPNYKLPHLKLGNLAYKQHKMAQALMCFNMYILLEPDAENAKPLLNQLNNLVTVKNANEVSEGISVSKDDSAFEEIDLILNQKVAINDGYDTGNEIDMALMKQTHALFTTLANFKGNDGFWDRKYVPFYQWVMNEGHFNDYTYTLTFSLDNEEYQKTITKNTDNIIAFLDLAKNKWAEILKNNPTKKGNKEVTLINFYENNYLRAEGEEINGSFVGDWKFYSPEAWITADGKFDTKGERHEKWIWYHENGTVKETAVYNHGTLEGPYLTYHENGRKKVITQYKNDKLDGEYLLYIIAKTKCPTF